MTNFCLNIKDINYVVIAWLIPSILECSFRMYIILNVYHNVPSSRPLFQWLKNEQDKRDGSYKQAGAARGFSWQTL